MPRASAASSVIFDSSCVLGGGFPRWSLTYRKQFPQLLSKNATRRPKKYYPFGSIDICGPYQSKNSHRAIQKLKSSSKKNGPFWSHRRFDLFQSTIPHNGCPKIEVVVQKKCKSKSPSAFNAYVAKRSNGRWNARPVPREAAMKRCALCHKELGLAARFRNIWNGGWWVHIRFCSALCKAIYQAKRNDAPKIAGTPSSLAAIRGAD
jgi:hypothetical protein